MANTRGAHAASSTVLVVIEDDDDQRELIVEVLRNEGYLVHDASNARDGLTLIAHVSPALVLCDVQMPEIDGYRALSEVRRRPSLAQTPFVLLSGVGVSARDVRAAMNLGADDYLLKPFSPDELLGAVRARLARAAQVAPSPVEVSQTVPSHDPHELAGVTVLDGRFRLDRVASTGGMGTVFEGRDLASDRSVAIKVAPAHDEVRNARLVREAEALAALEHPNIVHAYHTGRTPAGAVYLAMAWIDGCDLQHRLLDGALSTAETLALGRCIASALGASHAAGILHRDVKPSNVVLRGGRPECAVLVDFGLAHLPALTSMTEVGAVLGTMGYMAPEQVLGYRDLDARVDVFALGCVLFHALTNESPFVSTNALAAVASVLFDAPRRLADVRPDVPAALDALVAEMLARDPAQRPADGAAVLERLRALHAD